MARHKAPKPATRRPRGDGSLYQRRDGRWCVALQLPPAFPGAPRRRKVIYAATKEEVRQKRSAWEASQKPIITPGKSTFGALAAEWLANVAEMRVSAGALRTYRADLARATAINGLLLKSLTTKHIQECIAGIARTVSACAADSTYRKIRRVLEYAVTTEKLAQNPAQLVARPRVSHRDPTPYDAQTAQQFIAAIRDHPYEAGFWLSLCGLRAGEACGAPWDAVDWDAGTLQIRQQAKGANTTTIIDTNLKTKSSRRLVALPAPALDALRRARERWRSEAVARRPDARGLIIASPRGMIVHPASYHGVFKAVLRAHNLPTVRLHDLRHTYATLAMDGGASSRAVQAQLGHAHPSMTFAYTHPTVDGQRRAADAYTTALDRVAQR